MGYGPLLRRMSSCTTISANLHRSRLAFHTPSGPSDHLPHFVEKGELADRAQLDENSRSSERRQNFPRGLQMRNVDHLAVDPERAGARIGLEGRDNFCARAISAAEGA